MDWLFVCDHAGKNPAIKRVEAIRKLARRDDIFG